MDTYNIEILNPKAKDILENMADLKLISIEKNGQLKTDFLKLLVKLRKKSKSAPSLEEITQEVKSVRRKRYGK
jgi:hypothetical protein